MTAYSTLSSRWEFNPEALLRILRRDYGGSWQLMEDATGIPSATLRRWVSHGQQPRCDYLAQLAYETNKTMASFMRPSTRI